MGTTITNHLQRPEPQAMAATIEALALRFGNRLITSQAVRDQHAHTTTWLPPQPPDAVVMAQETADIQDTVRICTKYRVPVIAFGTGTSLEGHVNAPAGGISIDLRDMNRVLEVHADDLDCVIEPGVTRKALNEYLRDQGVFFPIDPGADASLGGMASTRASGTNAVRYGTMRDNVLALKRLGAAKPLSECLQQIGSRKGQKRLTEVLRQRPFPHYEAAPGRAGQIVRIKFLAHGTGLEWLTREGDQEGQAKAGGREG